MCNKWVGHPVTMDTAFRVEFWTRYDISRCVQIAMSVTTNEFQIFRKCDIAFDDPGAHSRRSFVTGFRMFRELQASTTMANGKTTQLKQFLVLGALGCRRQEASES